VTVNRLFLAALFAAAFVLAACSGTPGTGGSPRTGGGSPGTGGAAGDAALDALCGTGDASLSSIATQLDALEDDADTTQLNASLGEAISNLEDAEVDANASAAKDAATVALTQLQGALSDPATREQLATQAAQALRTLDTQVCT
jgi:hypothetical protein